MKKSDFKKGQTVYLLVIEGSNAYRISGYEKRPFEERIKEAPVVSVGSKYITVEIGNIVASQIKFNIENNFNQEVDAGGRNYDIFLNRQDVYDYQEKKDLIKEIRDAFNSSLWFDHSKYSLDQLRRIKAILNENK